MTFVCKLGLSIKHFSTYEAAWQACSDDVKLLGWLVDCGRSSASYFAEIGGPSVGFGWWCDRTQSPGDSFLSPIPCNEPVEWYMGTYVFTSLTPKSGGTAPGGSCSGMMSGNPINTAVGNKLQVELVYTGGAHFPLQLTAYYNSGPATKGIAYKRNWRTSYDRLIVPDVIRKNTSLNAYRPDGKVLTFTLNASTGAWQSDPDVSDTLVRLLDGAGNLLEQRYTTSSGELERYDATGKLTSITNRNGLTQTLSYDANGYLLSVTDTFGRALTFAPDANGRVASMTDPAGGSYAYTYTEQNNQSSITFPDTSVRTYLYENGGWPSDPNGLTCRR